MKLSLLFLSSIMATSNAMDVPQTDQSSSQTAQQLNEQPVTHPATAEVTSPDSTLINPTTLLDRAAIKMSETVWTAQQDSLLRRLEAQESSENVQSDLTNTLKDKLTLLATVCKLQESTSINIPETINQEAQLKSKILMDRLKEIYDNRKQEEESSQPAESTPTVSEVTTEVTPTENIAANYETLVTNAANRFAELFIIRNTDPLVQQLEERETAASTTTQTNAPTIEELIESAAEGTLLQMMMEIKTDETKKEELRDIIKREARRIRQQVMDHAKDIQEKKKVERELNRIADQIAAEYERVAPKVKRETQRIGKQVESLGKDIGKKLGLRKKRHK